MYTQKVSLPGYRLGTDVGDFGTDFAGANDGAGDLIWTFPVPHKCRLDYVGCLVTETCAGATTTPVLKIWKNGTSGTLLATLTLSTTAAGKFAYEQAASLISLTPGDRIDVELDVVGAGSGAAGQGFLQVVVDYVPETLANDADAVAV